MGTGRAHGLVAAGPPRARRRHRAELHGRACERPHLEVYFVDTPTFNKKNGIEDDSGYGEANGYGTVRQLDCR